MALQGYSEDFKDINNYVIIFLLETKDSLVPCELWFIAF